MNISNTTFTLLFITGLLLTSCVPNKKYMESQSNLQKVTKEAEKCNRTLANETTRFESTMRLREEQLNNLKTQLSDAKAIRDQQFTQVGDLTVLSKTANDNIKETLSQLEKKDTYIQYLNAARSKADSINLALAVNLKSVLKDGLADEDIEIKVDKTVVFINLSDKMLYQSGSSNLTSRAHEVLAKIALIIEKRADIDVMVEGYTDNVPIKTACIEDNWDLSVKRATSVVRVLQTQYNVNPNKLIAAGRGEYNTLSTNETTEGRSINRRTRIVILPKLNQFYDLLNPNNVPE
ncbi:OmpA/MotB family protein [Rasiella sp. SM2506]|uniref:OmpA/MotB family protein n=1 Tax=Rasiella sp. SM2506 TaxID=3423914 RepID=UPI003D78F791